MSGWSGLGRRRYDLLRALLGLYLAVHFAALVPWGAELFSREGVVPSIALNPLGGLLPNLLAVADSPAAVTGLLVAAAAASLLLAAGIGDRAAAVALWYVWACLLGRNPLIANPSIPYVGWLLLLHALAGPGRRDGPGWRLSPSLQAVAWAVLAVGYTYSGATKLGSPSWLDGTAVHHVLAGPLARPTPLRDALLALPGPLVAALTWGTLALELLFAPLGLVRRLRPWLWAALAGMHLGLLVLVDFADLSAGMLVVHAWTFDPAWVPRRYALPTGRVPLIAAAWAAAARPSSRKIPSLRTFS
ncbi:MAG: hypothetical protein KF878_35075 [Planctomycetes bacterium]|nr:hypothetical protein [Planctomycetota bacterium]